MSFGVYRPTMGVAGGHRELVVNRPMLEQRQQGEVMKKQQYNPITGDLIGGGPTSGLPPPAPKKNLSNFDAGLRPNQGALDAGLVPDKDVPAKRVDPSRNQSTSFHSGVACMAQETPWNAPVRSAITESCFGDGFCERAPERSATPDSSSRRSTPGQVVRTNLRPKDNLSGGCVASDRPVEHPLNLPGKASRAGPGRGSGGAGQIMQGPNGFVPMGPKDMEAPRQMSSNRDASPFRRACGGVAGALGGN